MHHAADVAFLDQFGEVMSDGAVQVVLVLAEFRRYALHLRPRPDVPFGGEILRSPARGKRATNALRNSETARVPELLTAKVLCVTVVQDHREVIYRAAGTLSRSAP